LHRVEQPAVGLATVLVDDPITLNLVIGLVVMFAGIWIATTEGGAVWRVSAR
jgi:hypothetical protein